MFEESHTRLSSFFNKFTAQYVLLGDHHVKILRDTRLALADDDLFKCGRPAAFVIRGLYLSAVIYSLITCAPPATIASHGMSNDSTTILLSIVGIVRSSPCRCCRSEPQARVMLDKVLAHIAELLGEAS